MSSSIVDQAAPMESPTKDDDESGNSQDGDEVSNEISQEARQQQQQQIIRYSTSTLFALRSSKLSQQKPAIVNMDLSCMAHLKPPPKTLIANMMPKFALNYQMPNRGEESISPLSFHSNSSSSSNLSYQKQRYQDANNGGDGYSNSRYYYNKYKSHDEGSNGGGNSGGGSSSRIIYKTTGANASNGNSIRFLKKAYNNKYEEQENSLGLISNKNILDNASRVITAADHRNSKKKLGGDDGIRENDDKSLNVKTNNNEEKEKQSPTDDANNNANDKNLSTNKQTEFNANDLKNLEMDMMNHLDDILNDLSIKQLLDDKTGDERESSRFSKWFNISKDEEVKDKKLPDSQNNNSNNNAKTLSSTSSALFPHESEKYFQPIDKVDNNNSLFQLLKGQDMQRNDPLINILQHSPQQPQAKSQASPNNSGQVHSVEELEAKLRHHKLNQQEDQERKNSDNEKKVLQNFFQQQLMPTLMQHQQQSPSQQLPQAQHLNQQNQEDINAFKKLLSQITSEENKIPPQMMVNKNFQHNQDMMMQYQKAFPMNNKMPPNQKMMNPHMMPPQPFGSATGMDLKFLQQQQQQPKLPMPEIIKRPEVQALVQELTSGEISQYTLWQRLTAPGLAPIEREIITCALNIFNTNSSNGNAGIFPKQQPIGNNLFPQTGPLGANQNPNATQAALHQLLQQQMKTTNLAAPIPMPPQTSPLSPVPPLDQHLLFQHQAAVAANKQLRLSPLPAGMPQRIPSPRELQYHTQSIMQNALIRKKLEEQRENFRKRQEQEKQESAKKNQQESAPVTVAISTSSSNGDSSDQQNIQVTTMAPSQVHDDSLKITQMDSPAKKTIAPVIAQHQIQRQHAPSPSIFTPTSVLRKMTAEKENDALKMTGDSKKKPITGVQQQQQPTSQHNPIRNQPPQQTFMNNIGGNISQMDARMKMQNDGGVFGMSAWDSPQQQQQQQQMQGMKPPGRPIVKSSAVPQNSMMQQQNSIGNIGPMMSSGSMNFDYQQQQQIQKMNQIQKAQFIQQQQQQQQMIQMKKQQMDNNPVLSQFMAQQQQRAQAQSQFRSQFQQQQQPMNFPPSMMQGRGDKPEDQLESRNMLNNGGCLSPTSNQLAKWFSPELLADASAGKLLPSLNVGQMMSLEELEKCMQNS